MMHTISETATVTWSTFKKFAFRFSFIFIFSFILVFNNGTYPLYDYISKPLTDLMHWLTPWFSKNVLGYTYDYSIFVNGSGDTSYAWISLLILLLLAFFAAVIWSILDLKRENYNTLFYWLTTAIRYYIAFMLINYGTIKLLHAQMPPPSLNRLMQPLGEYSPMGLAWTFIGFSKGYNILLGIVEILSGLLFFRKTIVLGALITIMTSINIMSINYFYDVPVKILSTMLFLFSLFLLLPFLQTLYSLFIKGDPGQLPFLQQPIYNKNWKRKSILMAKILILLFFAGQQIISVIDTKKMMAQYLKKPPFYGIYRIEKAEKDRKTIPHGWSLIIFEYDNNSVMVRDSAYKPHWESIVMNNQAKKLTLNRYQFDYTINQNGDILLSKVVEGNREEVKLIKQDTQQFELTKRRFNWIQEYPYNR
ncbi:hypothetical protein HX021_00275 [Sphingobacterium sp. N143]|uniref:hypothetical protein n=1 Tax=Sphingobacterium sp. N143 TaxID=2746727 RepID=UPI0025771062|nr:hypothetical protein [Sphingobacterium sp. N143]MDM1292728.1 hypothetical protein [Sphingobacterium sp. N143]